MRELQVAAEEGKQGPEPVTLDAVLDASRTLGAPEDTEKSAVNKQTGSVCISLCSRIQYILVNCCRGIFLHQ